MKTKYWNTWLRLLIFCIMGGTVMADGLHYLTIFVHDDLNRIVAIAEGSTASHKLSYDSSGNRTNDSINLGFSIVGVANKQIDAYATLSLPLQTTGSLPVSLASWAVRSSNHRLVPKSGLHVLGTGTASPWVDVTPTAGEVGTAKITIIASDGDVAASSSFFLTVGANRPPRAINDSVQHPPGAGIKVEIRKLLANDSDPDGDSVGMTTLSAASAHGGSVRFLGPFVAYDPPLGYDGPDFFNYSITDSHGATTTAMVTVKAQLPSLAVPSTVVATEVLPNNHRLLSFIGVPNLAYQIQASVDLVNWTVLGPSTSDGHGRYIFEDVDAEMYPIRYYRSVWP